MSPITHFLSGWMLSGLVEGRRERAAVAIAAVIPDIDGLGIIPEVLTRNSAHPLPWFTEYHHILGHNIGFALATTLVAFFVLKRKLKPTLLFFVAFHLHLLGDLIGARGPDGYQWPLPYLLPFSHAMDLTWSHQWALNAWPNFVITFALLGVTFYWAARRGYSPIEMVSVRADSAFVRSLRDRFGGPKVGTASA